MNKEFDKQDWDPLVDLLRKEVQEYGGLFNLLETQQKQIFKREADTVLTINEEVESYMLDMGVLRERREECVREMARRGGCSPDLSLSKMLNYFPEYIRPLLQALVEEVNHMVDRTRRKARQNHLLLSRTMELTQETISALQPSNYTKTYGRKGRVGVAGKMPTRYNALV